jgi:alkaline phosphatase
LSVRIQAYGNYSVSHASPAAFAVHVDEGDDETEIMESKVNQSIDLVFLGSGSSYLTCG